VVGHRCSCPVFLTDVLHRTIPISSLISPATLSTMTGISVNTYEDSVLNIGISKNELVDFYALWYNFTVISPNLEIRVQGPTASVERIINTVGLIGKQLLFPGPRAYPNTSYYVQTFVPLLRCQPSNASIRHQLTSHVSNLRGLNMNPEYFDAERWRLTEPWFTNDVGYYCCSRTRCA
jgi:hypothetical protein